MRIKTITCHEVYNYGAILQEYALLKHLNYEGHDAEVIHYKPPYLSGHFRLNAVSNPKWDKPVIKQLYLLAKLPGRLRDLKRKRTFDLFSQKYIPVSSKLYTTNEELKNDLPAGDAYICGSDQIWNSFFQNGKDPAFYLDFVPDNRLKIAYAASFATETIEEDIKAFVKKEVSRLDAVSVRETSGLRILEELGIKNAVQVLDPVFLLPASHWKENFISPIEEDYIFIYDCDNNPFIKEQAIHIKKRYGYKIYAANKNIKYADTNFYLEGPEKFLSLIYSSKLNLSNSFHALAFSIIFNKRFIAFNRIEKINTRMKDLLAVFNLPPIKVSESQISLIEDCIKTVDANLFNRLVDDSKRFLNNALIVSNHK